MYNRNRDWSFNRNKSKVNKFTRQNEIDLILVAKRRLDYEFTREDALVVILDKFPYIDILNRCDDLALKIILAIINKPKECEFSGARDFVTPTGLRFRVYLTNGLTYSEYISEMPSDKPDYRHGSYECQIFTNYGPVPNIPIPLVFIYHHLLIHRMVDMSVQCSKDDLQLNGIVDSMYITDLIRSGSTHVGEYRDGVVDAKRNSDRCLKTTIRRLKGLPYEY